jgi:hypothetical protein
MQFSDKKAFIFKNIEGATGGFPQNMLVLYIPIYSKNLGLIG